MVLASLIQPSQPEVETGLTVSYQKLESQGLLCKDPLLSVFFTGLSSIVLMMFRGNSLLRRLFFFF